MANEIRGVSATGTLYARLMNSSGQVWNTSGAVFEAYSAGSYADYDLPMTEQGNSNVYVASFPTAIITAGTYEYFVHRQAGASPAEGDLIINTGKIDWTGTNSVTVTASTGAMTGSAFRDYILRLGFKRTDKDSEIYEATTDAIQEMRRRFMFDEAETEKRTTDTISVLGDFKLSLESDFGLLLGITLEDGTDGIPLKPVTKSMFMELYPDINVTASYGYPEHYCIFGQEIWIGPIPDSTAYFYRKAYSLRAGTITSATAGVPFTDVYRDVLADNVLYRLYKGLGEIDTANIHRQYFEEGFLQATRRDSANSGGTFFTVRPVDA